MHPKPIQAGTIHGMNLLKNLNPESISHAHEKSACRPCVAEAIAETEAEGIGKPHVRLTHLEN